MTTSNALISIPLSKIRYLLIKPFVGGIPASARQPMKNNTPAYGMLLPTPLTTSKAADLTLLRLATEPASISMAALTRLWLKVNTRAAAIDSMVPQPIPIRINPTCASVEYASMRFAFFVAIADKPPKITPTTPKTINSIFNVPDWSTNTRVVMRRNPYTPSFTTTDDSIALTAVGAAVWKSGCQKWKGKTALLTMKVAVSRAIAKGSNGWPGFAWMRAARSAMFSEP